MKLFDKEKELKKVSFIYSGMLFEREFSLNLTQQIKKEI